MILLLLLYIIVIVVEQSKAELRYGETKHRKIRTRQAMFVKRNIEERSCDHCCSGKAISITYSVCVCVCLYP